MLVFHPCSSLGRVQHFPCLYLQRKTALSKTFHFSVEEQHRRYDLQSVYLPVVFDWILNAVFSLYRMFHGDGDSEDVDEGESSFH